VRATRAATKDELAAASRPRLAALAAEGVTTVEVKSGYGLATAAELRQLRTARRIAAEIGVDVRTTLLAAHAVPPEFAGRPDEYIDVVCRETIPEAAREGLADAVDAFCETIGFTPQQTRRVFTAARANRLRV
jgi:imidazolonepropionase